jgi:hypothetical protein
MTSSLMARSFAHIMFFSTTPVELRSAIYDEDAGRRRVTLHKIVDNGGQASVLPPCSVSNSAQTSAVNGCNFRSQWSWSGELDRQFGIYLGIPVRQIRQPTL